MVYAAKGKGVRDRMVVHSRLKTRSPMNLRKASD